MARTGVTARRDPTKSAEVFLALADRALNPGIEKVPLQRTILALPDGSRFLTRLTRALPGTPDGVQGITLALDQKADGKGPSTVHAAIRYDGVDCWMPVRVLSVAGNVPTYNYAPCAIVRCFVRGAQDKPHNEPKALRRVMDRCNDFFRDLPEAAKALVGVSCSVPLAVGMLGLAHATVLRPHVRATRVLAAVRLLLNRAKDRTINFLDVLWALNTALQEGSGMPAVRAMRIAEGWAAFMLDDVLRAAAAVGKGHAALPQAGEAANYNLRPATDEETNSTPLFARGGEPLPHQGAQVDPNG